MKISIHQPDYIPYIGYFYKISQSDIFVFLDDAQFSSDNMHHWNKIKISQGELRLKIPVENKLGYKINEVRTRDELKWKVKHIKTIEMNYSKAVYFKMIFPQLKEIILSNYKSLAELNIAIIKFICDGFCLNKKFILSSKMNILTKKEERVIDICKNLKGIIYISGNGAKAYQVDKHFEENNLKLIYTDYKPFIYTQLWKKFIPNMSIIDYILNCGFDWEFIENNIRGCSNGNR